jgi:hypothetical protein
MPSNVSALSGFGANGHQAVPHVSCSPSEIPYGGFSPVRLQTGSAPGHLRCLAAYRPAAVLWALHTLAHEGAIAAQSRRTGKIPPDPPVQRPLARHRVVLSRCVIAYYGLIRASESLPPTYGFRRRVFAANSQNPEGPQFKLRVCRAVPSPVPRRTGWWLTVRSPPVLPSSLWERLGIRGIPLQSVHVGGLSRLQSSLDAAARIVASPSPTRAFTFELSFHESPLLERRI